MHSQELFTAADMDGDTLTVTQVENRGPDAADGTTALPDFLFTKVGDSNKIGLGPHNAAKVAVRFIRFIISCVAAAPCDESRWIS